MQGILYGIGVGPGDPELLTLKGLRVIKASDVIALPAKDKESCTSYSIVKGAYTELDEKEFIYLDYPMSKDKELLKRCRDENEKIVMDMLDKGKSIAFLTLGDPTIYSTYIYLHKSICEKGYQAEIISGIPSFVAAAGVVSDSLCEADEQIHILPATYGIDEVGYLKGTKVLMKAGTKLKEIKKYVKEKDCVVYSIENLYLPNENIVTDKNDIKEKGGYFTTVIIKDKGTNR